MLFHSNELVEQEEIEIFNNIGFQNNVDGRLTVKLIIDPTPRIDWEFESATADGWLQDPFSDSPIRLTSHERTDPRLVIDRPQITKLRNRFGLPPRNSGNALQVMYGDINAPAHRFEFYLANACFIYSSRLGTLTQNIQEHGGRTRKKSPAGRAIQASLEEWMLDLEASQVALDWLNPNHQNRGSMITISGLLCQAQIDFSKSDELPSSIQATSLLQVRDLLSKLGWLISFANAGYLGPLYIKAERYTSDQYIVEPVAAAAFAYTTTPIEVIGTSWVTDSSNLQIFFECFPSFQRMLSSNAWKEKWMLLLEWYFQAIPCRTEGRTKTWFITSNALGALIEHLARLILVNDETNLAKKEAHEKLFKMGKSKERLECLLTRIGVVEEEALIKDFIDIRNDATHSIIKNVLTVNRRNEVIQRATQWVEEVLLWRIGYSSNYLDRSDGYGIQPRYDISKRNPDW